MSSYDYGTEADAITEWLEDADLTPAQQEVKAYLRKAESAISGTLAAKAKAESAISGTLAAKADAVPELPTDDRPTMDPEEYAALAAYGKALEARAAAIKAALKKVRPATTEGEPVPVVLPDGSTVGAVHCRAGYSKYSVKDKAAFLDHVSRAHPDQVTFAVDPKFQKHLLGVARHQDVPGVGVTTVAPTYEVDVPEQAYEKILSYATENPDFGAMIGT